MSEETSSSVEKDYKCKANEIIMGKDIPKFNLRTVIFKSIDGFEEPQVYINKRELLIYLAYLRNIDKEGILTSNDVISMIERRLHNLK